MFGKTSAFDSTPTIHIGLSSTTPTDTGGNVTEPSGGAYARQATAPSDWNDPATAATVTTIDNAEIIEFSEATADYVSAANLTHFVAFDALTTGNYLGSGTLNTPKPVLNGDTPSFAAGEVNLTMAPAA
jgi:hypothetical protein